MSSAKDLETYKSVFGVDNIVYSKSVTFIYDEKGKRRKIYSSLFLTPEHMSIISTTNDFKYRIPLDNISDLSTEGRVLKYYIHLVYGNQDKHYTASIDFTTKSDGDAFISLLNLAKSVDNKRQELEKEMSDEVKRWKQQISELDSEKETLSKEKDKIENEYKNENEGLNGKLQKELNDVYSIKKQLKLQEQELQNTINEEKTKLQDYKAQELAALDESKKALVNSIEELDAERKNLVVENERLSGEISFKEKKIKELEANIEDKIIDSDLKDIFVNHFEENITSKELNDQLSMLSLDEKDMVNNDEAVYYYGYSEKKSHINSQIKQILRSFNTECDYLFSSLTSRNYDNYHKKIVRSYEALNKIYKVDNVEITRQYLQIKLEKLNLINERAIKIEQEKALQREIKEQMKEEEKVRRELEQQEKKIAKEETQFSNEIKNLFKRLEKSQNDIEKELYADKIKELEEKVKQLEADKKDVENRKLNTRAGYVYVISNIGSFGEGIYKIGLTRRLEPYDRVKELGDASVPFEFDVHAMIFSDDAPTLESTLHRHFRDRELNKVNHRKEFFKVDIDEIEEVVKNNHNNTVEFTKIPVAEQYWESQNISQASL
ncbi:DUF4041 domain-containing protein [Staphylococcus aureus]|uniref:DUF4041 domain-containing protein n=1 Tax=Staphylococcus aureus TaxID=1280 RepID=UPI00263C6AFF|nr:DUF4041 domain-containing protein [Staphylococcus aureus]MDN5191599.1 DUF4041 domain-containing protein [Staphylococcus aureus]MDN5194247.1 DUF4041 domain-containing protein [Staphylococcus aureus]MDN5196753.1 DUF4041 domain-containing protein [Staphylococcus aureus]MDN5199540.1 DUF4041 domain-containing protein [Staphylococcus aureus]MDN5220123.1 DUF4041 domain-containing protein [Staphylococcus aureus]